MVWCGFDESMRLGVVEYAEGIAQAIKTKARSNDLPLSTQIEQERNELKTLERLIEERVTKAGDNDAVVLQLRAFLGLVSVARFLIEGTPKSEAGIEPDLNFSHDAYTLASLIQQFDQHYETLPQGNGHSKNASIALTMTIPHREEEL